MDTTTQKRLAAKYASSEKKDSSSAATINVTGKRGNMGATGKPKEMWKTFFKHKKDTTENIIIQRTNPQFMP